MSISGQTPEQPTYRTDFKESVDLFEKSFQAMQTSKLDAQKDKFANVMQTSLKMMQESVNGLLNQRLSDLRNHLSHDVEEYLNSPTLENQAKVASDLEQIKNEEP
jgi:hypothetical protein